MAARPAARTTAGGFPDSLRQKLEHLGMLTDPVIAKLRFIHETVAAQSAH
jgi:hypothetical protein